MKFRKYVNNFKTPIIKKENKKIIEEYLKRYFKPTLLFNSKYPTLIWLYLIIYFMYNIQPIQVDIAVARAIPPCEKYFISISDRKTFKNNCVNEIITIFLILPLAKNTAWQDLDIT